MSVSKTKTTSAVRDPKQLASKVAELYNQADVFGADYLSEQQLIDLLSSADDLFFNAPDGLNSPLSDAEYDAIKRYGSVTYPRNPYFTGIGHSARGGKVDLPSKMGSLTQVYENDTQTWVSKHNVHNETAVISGKLDGTSALLVYGPDGKLQQAFSRGDGVQGADITRHVARAKSVPITITPTGERQEIRAEAIFTKQNFEHLQTRVLTRSGTQYRNPRNMVAGLMNADVNDPIVYDYIDIVAYQIVVPNNISKQDQFASLRAHGFKTPDVVTVVARQMSDDYLTTLLNKMRDESPYELDGVVIEMDSVEVRSRMNPSKDTLNPEYARKYKVASADNYAQTVVQNVEWSVSKDGYLKPRVCFEPVDLMGVTIKYATGFNAKFIADNGVGPGAVISITRSGDVIPFISSVDVPATPLMPAMSAKWTETGVDLVLDQTDRHIDMIREQLLDFFSTIDAPLLKEGSLEKLIESGYDTPESIINLSHADMSSAIGSRQIASKIVSGLASVLTDIPPYKLMGAHKAFGRGVGVRKLKKLYEAARGDINMFRNVDWITSIDGFETKTASKIAAGVDEYVSFVESINDKVTFEQYAAPIEGQLTGQSFVFSGFRDSSLEQRILSQGGEVKTSVSSKTSYLVTTGEHSTKTAKAESLGVKIINKDELEFILGD